MKVIVVMSIPMGIIIESPDLLLAKSGLFFYEISTAAVFINCNSISNAF